jgi:proteic killer suppression protein
VEPWKANVIRRFRHKGLRAYYEAGTRRGIRPDHAARLARILDRLDASVGPSDMDLPGYRLHPLSGEMAGTWAVSVSGNWRVTFRFDGQDAVDVDYIDYH